MKKRVMILGGSRYNIRSIIGARELGIEVVVTDRNPKAEGFQYADHHEVVDITDIDQSIKVARRYKINGVIAINDFGVRTAAAIAQELELVGITSEVAKYATSKEWMRKKWGEAGIPSARFKIVRSLDGAYKAVRELNTWPLVFKPVDSRGGGSRGVSILHNMNQVQPALDFAQNF